MKKLLMIIGCSISLTTFAATAPIKLEKAYVNPRDHASLKRGAEFYAKNCLICHSLKHMRYNKLAQAAGITYDKMPTKDQEWWFGAAPPDLSLITNARGADWVYTYLLSFYTDVSTQLGTSNLLMPNVAMPNPFLALQGEQQLVVNKEKLLTHGFEKTPKYFNVLELVKQGKMTNEEFDRSVNDLVNFLAYAADPVEIERENIGGLVILFLIIFAIVAFFLQKEYWKDIKRKKPKPEQDNAASD